ncbi:MAG: hypothetical protein GY776_15805 [Alteromonas sp.]|nr:hypothetical protein [Alteromonas sp.]
MAITTYSELKTSVANWLNRDDLTATIPDFVSLAEARIARDLRHWKQEKRVTTDANERYENLPNDLIEIRQVQHTSGGVISSISSVEMENRRAALNTTGKPKYMRLTAEQIEFYPTPDTNYSISMLYYGRIPALSDVDTSNWLLRDAPDVLLYGALLQSAPYLVDDARVQVWAGLYQSGIEALNVENEKARVSGPLSMGVPR